jgi:hypothetical protein
MSRSDIERACWPVRSERHCRTQMTSDSMNTNDAFQTAADAAAVSIDEALTFDMLSTQFLLAVGTGKVDLNALARIALAGRGVDGSGKWVGFKQAEVVWS